MRAHFGFALFVSSIFFSACSARIDAPAPLPEPAPPPAPQPEPAKPARAGIAFVPCSMFTGQDGREAECAHVEVPLDWSDPEGAKAVFFVKRVVGTAQKRKQVWLLQGGPGGAGDGLEDIAWRITRRDTSLDVYIPDHRGTGRSTYLDCPRQSAVGLETLDDWKRCATEVKTTWGDGLKTFSTTTAARDVGYVIDETRDPDQEVHVYGVSYGTYWAQRYLQIFPTQPTSVTLDGVCQSGICSLSRYGAWFDAVGKKFLGECAADAFCASQLGADPVAKVKDALAALGDGRCQGVTLGTEDMRQVMTLFLASFQLRNLVPAIAHRVLRCSPEDVAALNHMATVVMKWVGGRGRDRGDHGESLYSNVLGNHIALSELEESPPRSREDLAQLYADVVFARRDLTMRDLYDVWPRYEHDAFVGRYPESTVPVLMLNGTLDPQTPLEFAQTVAPHFVAPAQQLVVLPRAAHGTVDQSPTVKNGEACGKTLWLAFVGAPRDALDTSCTERILPHDFQGGEALAGTVFGTASLWSRAPARRTLSLEDELALRGEVMRARTSDWRLQCSESSRRLRKPAL